MKGEKQNATWYSTDELQQSHIVNYYKKRIRMRQRNISIIPEYNIKNPLSVTNNFAPPEGVEEDATFFSSFINSKPIFTNGSSLKKIGVEKVDSIYVSSDLNTPSITESEKDIDNNVNKKNVLIEQQQLMISGKDTLFVSPSFLECYDQNLFLQIYEKGNENE